jgi:hypothetical protein
MTPRSTPAPSALTRAVRIGGKKRNAPRTPLSASPLPARCRPPWLRQHRPTVLCSRDQSPPAHERGRRARCCSMRIARAPKPASFWTPSPPMLRPIKAPADQTNQLAPLPATSQTTPFLPARSSLTSPAPPAWYWTQEAPSTPTAIGATAGARWRSGAAAVDLLPRRQALLPLCHALTVEQSSLQTPVSSSPSQQRRCLWAVRSRSIGSVPIRCGLSDLTSGTPRQV